MTAPATETTTMGLPGQFSVCRVFCCLSYQLYHDGTTSRHLSGPAKKLSSTRTSATNHTGWPLCLSGRHISRQIRLDENIIYIWTETA
jgi:hypothetical protein